ncbi:hypothetical protein MHYP_G00183060 [Metynnis hypsauchen]
MESAGSQRGKRRLKSTLKCEFSVSSNHGDEKRRGGRHGDVQSSGESSVMEMEAETLRHSCENTKQANSYTTLSSSKRENKGPEHKNKRPDSTSGL